MQETLTLVIATGNPGKTAEIRDLLKGFPINIKNLDEFGPLPPVVEDGDTFDENAYKKASFISKILGYPALADDSGLVVEALGGAPGVYSARYAGENASDQQRCTKLIEEMKGHTNRQAAFECVISLAVPTGAALTYEGRCEGFGELSREEKSRISHRGKALGELKDEFDKVLIWIRQNMPIQEKFRCEHDNT